MGIGTVYYHPDSVVVPRTRRHMYLSIWVSMNVLQGVPRLSPHLTPLSNSPDLLRPTQAVSTQGGESGTF